MTLTKVGGSILQPGLSISGIVTATSFVGSVNASQLTGSLPAINGSALTGLTKTLTVGVRVGTAVTFNITGSSFNVSARSGSVAINV